MNRIELLFISVAVFLTIIAWMIIDIYHIQIKDATQTQIQPVSIPSYKIDTSIFPLLRDKTP